MEKLFLVLPFYFFKNKNTQVSTATLPYISEVSDYFSFFSIYYIVFAISWQIDLLLVVFEKVRYFGQDRIEVKRWGREILPFRDMQCFFRRGIRNLFEVKPVFRSVQNREKNTTKKWSNQPLPAACLSLHFILTTNFRFSFFTVRFAEASVDSVWSVSSIFRVFIFWLMLSLPAHCCWKRFRCINVQKRVDV